MNFSSFSKVHSAVSENISRVIVGKKDVTDLAVICLLCGGHMLIDDVPGTGKTVFAKTFASALNLSFKRIQCVPDMLPSDLIGVNYYDMKQSEFRFIKGPVFTNILLADEINRAMPKTQSGLLECMEEKQVSIEGVSFRLAEPFMVIATQNPVESKGTFELPEAQLDRFLVKTSMGYPTHEESVEILTRKLCNDSIATTQGQVNSDIIKAASRELEGVYVHKDILSYTASICEATRNEKNVILGASPRAMIALIKVARGYAAIDGRSAVLPDDIKKAAVPVLSHRIVFSNGFLRRGDMGKELVEKVLLSVTVPSERIDFSKR